MTLKTTSPSSGIIALAPKRLSGIRIAEVIEENVTVSDAVDTTLDWRDVTTNAPSDLAMDTDYTVAFSVTDASGNIAEKTATVRVFPWQMELGVTYTPSEVSGMSGSSLLFGFSAKCPAPPLSANTPGCDSPHAPPFPAQDFEHYFDYPANGSPSLRKLSLSMIPPPTSGQTTEWVVALDNRSHGGPVNVAIEWTFLPLEDFQLMLRPNGCGDSSDELDMSTASSKLFPVDAAPDVQRFSMCAIH